MTMPTPPRPALLEVAAARAARYKHFTTADIPGDVITGDCLLLGYSWYNTGGIGIVRIWDGAAQAGLRMTVTYFAAAGDDSKWYGPQGIHAERGLYVSATVATISGTVFYVPLLD